jgi:transcriptional regulator with XRE-family HTH domain
MSNAAIARPAARRREAGEFLRSRRERLAPADVGLPNGFRRRTPGLRRDEVAMLADIGTTWYTWLEQGRDVRPSNELLSALAEALRLDPTERRHLFVLYDRRAPERPLLGPERVDEPLRRMLDSLTGQPAYVLGRRWDILAWNRAADAVYGSYERLQGEERNTLTCCSPIRTTDVCSSIGKRWPALRSPCFAPIARATLAIRILSGLLRV